mmetsp:Transcript_10595/g.16774  ORF Transcript_10595/g.16774 Transcript_10595/m.16774 type:complete len:212 (-) Transcript_10595:583-1218(-)
MALDGLFALGGHVELKMDDITVLNNVLFAFLSVFASCFELCHALASSKRIKVVPSHDLCLDKPALKVAVNHSGGLRCKCPAVHSPAAYLLLAGSEKVDHIQFVIARHDHFWHRTFSLRLLHVSRLGGGIITKVPDFLFVFNGERYHDSATVFRDPPVYLCQPPVLLRDEVSLSDIDKVDTRLSGNEGRKFELDQFYFRRVPLARSNRRVGF